MTTTAVQKTEKAMEFTPLGAADKIKLSVEIVKNFVAVPTKSGALCSDRDAMRFMMLCQAQRLNPFAGDAFLTGYDSKDGPKFSMITAHVAFLKRAESAADYEGFESGVILVNENGTTTERQGDFHLPSENIGGGWAKVYRKEKKPFYRALAFEQRRPDYSTKFWEGAKASEQIVKCAEADALRAAFPSLLGGLKTENEEGEVSAIVETVARAADPVKRIESAGQATAPEVSPQVQLEQIILGAGFTFDDLLKVGEDSGQIPPDSYPSFPDIPTDLARRLVRTQKTLLQALGAYKEKLI